MGRRAAIIGGVAALGVAGAVALPLLGGKSHWAAHPPAPGATVADLLPDADPAAGAALFRRCAACHTIGREAQDVSGPNLYGVVGAPVAARRVRYGYTAALRGLGGVWTFERLDAWLRDPQGVARGTSMAFAGLPAATDRADVIAYLNTQGPGLPLPPRSVTARTPPPGPAP